MTKNESEMIELAESVRAEYFADIEEPIIFECKRNFNSVAVEGRVGGIPVKLTLLYGESKLIRPAYRMAWVPVVAHELAHLINPVDPESVMEKRLPEDLMMVWRMLRESGGAQCSMGGKK